MDRNAQVRLRTCIGMQEHAETTQRHMPLRADFSVQHRFSLLNGISMPMHKSEHAESWEGL